MLERIVSGGQTGVDRAALDAAMASGIPVGGWCPRGRRAVDGHIPAKYPLKETRGKLYQTRTRWNVRDSDATLIICRDEPTRGTTLTISFCEKLHKPYYVYQLRGGETTWVDAPENPHDVLYWLNCFQVCVLNVAGPREGKDCPIYDHAYGFLAKLFALIRDDQRDDTTVREPVAHYFASRLHSIESAQLRCP